MVFLLFWKILLLPFRFWLENLHAWCVNFVMLGLDKRLPIHNYMTPNYHLTLQSFFYRRSTMGVTSRAKVTDPFRFSSKTFWGFNLGNLYFFCLLLHCYSLSIGLFVFPCHKSFLFRFHLCLFQSCLWFSNSICLSGNFNQKMYLIETRFSTLYHRMAFVS